MLKELKEFAMRGNVIECTTYYTGRRGGGEENSEGFLPYKLVTTNKYDSNGNIIESATYDTKSEPGDEDECGYPPCRTLYVYEYDPKGTWTKQTEFSCTRAKAGKYECQKLEGETNRTITYYGTGPK